MKTTSLKKAIGLMTSVTFTTSLMLCPLKSWSENQTTTSNDEVILKSGDLAPFYGVLVPDPKYRFYRVTVAECAYKDQHERACDCDTTSHSSLLPWLVSSFALGAVAGLALSIK